MSSINTDVIVVGGGIAGVAAAYFISQNADTQIVEQESQLAYHTTGRSAALFLDNYGGPVNERLTAASRPFLESHAHGEADHDLLEPIGYLRTAGQRSAEELRVEGEAARQLIPELELISVNQILDLVPVIRPEEAALGLWNPRACSVDVMALHQAFLRGAKRNGAGVVAEFRAGAITRNADVWEVVNSDRTIRAPVLVNAAGAWGDKVAQLAGVKPIGLTPMRRTAFTVPASHEVATWPFVEHDESPHTFYFKPESGGQLLCSPADETPVAPTDAKAQEIDVARAIDSINAITTLGIRSMRASWAGLRTFAPDRNPVIGWDHQVDGFFWLVGQGGTGIQTSPAAGMATASVVCGKPYPDSFGELSLTAELLTPRR